MKPAFLFERVRTRWLEALPHPESVRNLNEPRGLRGGARRGPRRWCTCAASARSSGPRRELRAATLGAAAAGVRRELDEHVLAALNGDQVARDPLEPLAEGDDVAFMAADAGG